MTRKPNKNKDRGQPIGMHNLKPLCEYANGQQKPAERTGKTRQGQKHDWNSHSLGIGLQVSSE